MVASVAAALCVPRPSDAFRCAAQGAAVESAVPLEAGEQLGRLAINRAPDGAVWIAARVLPGRFARRPRTRVVAGAFDPRAQRWIVAPVEIASLPGRAELPIAIAVSSHGATVLVSRPRAVLVRTLSTAAQLSAPIEWRAPRTATSPALLDAQSSAYSVLWRSAARLTFARANTLDGLSTNQPTFVHVTRRGALGGDGLIATIAESGNSAWALFAQRTGAVSMVRVQDAAVAERLTQPARCPDHCELFDAQTTADGAIVTFAMKVRHERILRSFWATRITRSGHHHSGQTIPVHRALGVSVDERHTALAQLSRPVILRAIDRPAAITSASLSVARTIRVLPASNAAPALVVTAHDRGALSWSTVACVD